MKKRDWLFLWLMGAILLFVGNDCLLITDSVESNYALTAKEMVLSGDWLSPQIYGRYWFDKPIFFYWLTALGFKLFGFTEFGARFFPAVFGMCSLGLIAYGGARLYSKRTGWISAFILLTSVEFFLISKSIITDAALFFFFSGTLLFFYLGYRDGSRIYWYIMYSSAALGVLTKGPIGVLLPGLIITVFLLWRREWQVLKRCKLFSGVVLFLTIAAPWYLAMYQLHGDEFFNMFFGVHNYLRATVSEHPRDNVIYYYLLVNILAFFPWSLLLPLLIWQKYQEHNWHFSSREGFLLIWIITVFGFFQCMATKYITYTYPLVFPLALLFGHIIDKHDQDMFSREYLYTVVTFLFILSLVAWCLSSKNSWELHTSYLLPLSLVVGVLLYRFIIVNGYKSFIGIGALCICFYIALIHSVAIPLTEQRSAKDLGQLLKLDKGKNICTYGDYPTSAVFYSDKLLYKLVAEKEVSGYIPRELSWSSKNVMPYKILESREYKQVTVKNKNLYEFLSRNRAQWVIVGVAEQWTLLEKRI